MHGRASVSGRRDLTRVERRDAAVSVADAIQATDCPGTNRLIAPAEVNGAVIIPHPAESGESSRGGFGISRARDRM
jgi:hypothetical protein